MDSSKDAAAPLGPAAGEKPFTSAPEERADASVEDSRAPRRGHVPGMRREWNFTLTFVHEAARVQLRFPPHWEPGFIEAKRIEELNRLDRDVKHCPMTPGLRFTDYSTAQGQRGMDRQSSAAVRGVEGESIHRSPSMHSLPRDLLLFVGKQVELLYSHIPPFMTLSAYCTGSVKHILKDPNVISVDGHRRLRQLKIQKKLTCPYRLGGHRSFHFYYNVAQKSELVAEDVVYCWGTIIGQRGYLLTVRCHDPDELRRYVQQTLVPYFSDPSNIQLNAAVSYSSTSGPQCVPEEREHYGELRYEDRDAAISYAVLMRPMRLRPDFSPTKTVGVGSIACLTMELNVYERLMEDAAVAEITGMPQYKVNQVVLCVEVEDVARMNYPGAMTTEEYSVEKVKRLQALLPGSATVGTATSIHMGTRIGRSQTITFEYEPLRGMAKALCVSTLTGNLGVTAYYLTKMGGGYFETHLYIFKELLSRLVFHQQHRVNFRFSRFDVMNVRLIGKDLHRCYLSAPVDNRKVYEAHMEALEKANDGQFEGGRVVPVPIEDGGYEEPETFRVVIQKNSQSGRRTSINYSPRSSNASCPSFSNRNISVDAGSGLPRPNIEGDGEGAWAGVLSGLPPGEDREEEDLSSHCSSVISVSSIAHLRNLLTDEDVEEGIPCSALEFVEGRAGAGTPLSGAGRGSRLNSIADPSASAANSSVRIECGAVQALEPSGSRRRQSIGSVDDVLRPVSVPLDQGEGLSAETSSGKPEMLAPTEGSHLVFSREALTKPAAQLALEEMAKEGVLGEKKIALQEIYRVCCEEQQCKPNSVLFDRLPSDPEISSAKVEVLDLTSNYVGRAGLAAVARFIAYLPYLTTLRLSHMSLENQDVELICETLSRHPAIKEVHLSHNPAITPLSTKPLKRLLRDNKKIHLLDVHGTRLGDGVIAALEAEAASRRQEVPFGTDLLCDESETPPQ